MLDSIKDHINFEYVEQHFEKSGRFLSFLNRIEKKELKKSVRGILTSYTNRNWESLHKECQYIKELSDFLLCTNCSRVAENLKIHCRLTYINNSLLEKGVFDTLTHIENISQSIRRYLLKIPNFEEICGPKEEYEFLSYDSVRYRDIEVVKTVTPCILSSANQNFYQGD